MLIAIFLSPDAHCVSPEWNTLPSRVDDDPGFVYHPSPPDWRETTIYQLITDRFYDGDPSNNTAHPDGPYNPLAQDGIHGGDFAGVTRNLDYIQHLGFDTIWISPVYLNKWGVYHGYHIVDFNRIDPHWGSLEELRDLVDAAHRRGMYVILDVVFNHMARMLTSDDPGYPRYSEEPYTLRWLYDDQRFAPPFDDPALFHAHGTIGNYDDPIENVRGELKGLADLRTEDPRVREWLTESHLALIAATDCDGFRIDTARHVEIEFWQQVLPALRRGAARLGKTNFLMFAEALHHRDDAVSVLTREGAFESALYYPYFFTLQHVWGRREATGNLSGRWMHRTEYGERAMDQLVVFADNHDRERLLNKRYLGGDIDRMHAILTQLYATPGIPCVYYGTEQQFDGPKGHGAREPMFDPLRPGVPDRLDASAPSAQWVRKLNAVRRAYPALVTGDLRVLHEEGQAGAFAFIRETDEERALIVLNNSTEAKTLELNDAALTGSWIEIFTRSTQPATNAFSVPADTTQIWVPSNQYRRLPPVVVGVSPAHSTVTGENVERIVVQLEGTERDLPAARAMVSGRPVTNLLWSDYGQTVEIPIEAAEGRVDWSFDLPSFDAPFTSHFHTREPEMSRDFPLAAFGADGKLDAGADCLASNAAAALYAAFDRASGMLYLATTPARTNEDRFIMLSFTSSSERVIAPWNKNGMVPAYDILIADEGESGYTSVRGTRELHWSRANRDGVLEAAIHMKGDERLYIRAESYETTEGGGPIAGASLPAEEDHIVVDVRELSR